MPVHQLKHPLISDRLAVLRDIRTSSLEFRSAVDQISGFLAYELAATLSTREREVTTPLGTALCTTVDRERVVIVPILRAGLGLLPGVQRVFPTAPVLHLGIYRDEASLEPVFYYRKMSTDLRGKSVVLLDPMLATGGTITAAADMLQKEAPANLSILALIASRPGLSLVAERFPDVAIFAGAVDSELDDRGFIVPGLGDAGDRMFGTE